MELTRNELAMLDGQKGLAIQKAMELLVKYGEALGAERLVDTSNVAGVPGQSSPFLHNYYKDYPGGKDVIFSHFDLDSDVVVDVPNTLVSSCHLQGGVDQAHPELFGVSAETAELYQNSENYAADHGIKILKTCTPYLAGNVPVRGEHCAWMESSAVIYCNAVLGAYTNTEGRESTSAAMITGKIPDWGLHKTENRYGSHRIDVEVSVKNVMDWGMLGYFSGKIVQEKIPVLNGNYSMPDLLCHKHFGAAAASSGGVEMYHVVGATPEAETLEMAFGPKKPVEIIKYGETERRQTYEDLNARARDPQVDYIMLGCPHYSLEQIRDVCRLLEGKKISVNCNLWIFTSRFVKQISDQKGYSEIIRQAGGVILTDSCSAIGQAIPEGTKVVALDSAKQTHYLPAIMGIEAWFGSMEDCIDAALTGRWNGKAP
ncbi:MAG: aconitase X catalytic domain-containing protein [Emcibacter sp.]|nr:aconitase X catalytic domain-containing protein [Emcibacter sp.]